MTDEERDVVAILDRITTLEEPYQQNAVEWLGDFTNCCIADLQSDMPLFLGTLKPIVRRNFMRFVCLVLDEAAEHFSAVQ